MEGEQRSKSPALGPNSGQQSKNEAKRSRQAQQRSEASKEPENKLVTPSQNPQRPEQNPQEQKDQQAASNQDQQLVPANPNGSNAPYKTVERVLTWPVVDSFYRNSIQFYGYVKGSNRVTELTFTFVENTALTVNMASRPIIRTFNMPIRYIDNQLDHVAQVAEVTIPALKKPPKEFFSDVTNDIIDKSQPLVTRVKPIVFFTKDKMNRVFSTSLGHMVAMGVDNVMQSTDNLVDRWIPPKTNESHSDAVPLGDDPVLHLAQTAAFIMSKVAMRVTATISAVAV